jgi:peptidoglycan/xylan/chitin deacetylase (PgdA/CDA1 family)
MHLRALAVTIFLLLFAIQSAIAADATIPILAYHRFDPARAAATTITDRVFEAQLAWLASRKIAVIRLHEVVDRLRKGAPLPESAVALTADDGHESVYTDMFPLIQRYRVPVTLFIYPSAISNASYALTWDQIREMLKSGLVDVQSHTYWHPNFNVERSRLAPRAYEDFVRRQLTLSKSKLETMLGIHVDLLAWPFGIHDAQLERLAAETGYVAAFTIERGRAQQGSNLFALPRYCVTDADRGDRFAALVLGFGRGAAR